MLLLRRGLLRGSFSVIESGFVGVIIRDEAVMLEGIVGEVGPGRLAHKNALIFAWHGRPGFCGAHNALLELSCEGVGSLAFGNDEVEAKARIDDALDDRVGSSFRIHQHTGVHHRSVHIGIQLLVPTLLGRVGEE